MAVMNNTMMLKTAEIFISKFLDTTWSKLMRLMGVKINAHLEGYMQKCKLVNESDYYQIKKQALERNALIGISGFLFKYQNNILQ